MIPNPVIMGQSTQLLFKPDELSNSTSLLKTSGFNSIQLTGFLIKLDSDIAYTEKNSNNEKKELHLSVIEDGMYTYSSRIPSLLLTLVSNSSTIGSVCASFSGLNNSVTPIYDNINSQNSSSDTNLAFIGSPLERNFKAFKNTFVSINTINLDISGCDLESTKDPNALIAFVIMLNKLNFGVTFSFRHNDPATPDQFAAFLLNLIKVIDFEKKKAQNNPNGISSTGELVKTVNNLSFNVVRGLLVPTYGLLSEHYPPYKWTQAINNAFNKKPNPPVTLNTNGFVLLGFEAGDNKIQADLHKIVNNPYNKNIIGGAVLQSIDDLLLNNIDKLNAKVKELCLGLNEVMLKIELPQGMIIKLLPVTGIPIETNNKSISYAFCSPIFTLQFLNKKRIPVVAPLVLELQLPIKNPKAPIFKIRNVNLSWKKDKGSTNNTFESTNSTGEKYKVNIIFEQSELTIITKPV